MKSAFTMVELVFVIIVIGILSVVAIPKLTPLVGTAKTGKAQATLASVRSALSTERQKRILRGELRGITDLGNEDYAFKTFSDADGDTGDTVLEYPIKSCSNGGCWKRVNATAYKYFFSSSSGDFAKYKLDKNHLKCTPLPEGNSEQCSKLEGQ